MKSDRPSARPRRNSSSTRQPKRASSSISRTSRSSKSSSSRPSSSRSTRSTSQSRTERTGKPSRPGSRTGASQRRDSSGSQRSLTSSSSTRTQGRDSKRPSSQRRESARPRSSSRNTSTTDTRRTSSDSRTSPRGERRERRDDQRPRRRTDGVRSERGSSTERSRRTHGRGDGVTSRRNDSSAKPRDSRRDNRNPGRRDDRVEHDRRPERSDSKNQRQGARGAIAPKPVLPIPRDIDVSIVPKAVQAEIRLIAPHTQDLVKQYLAVAITMMESGDFERAYEYAKAARDLASRLATVREIAGLTAYYASKWAEALSEFKTYFRMTGDPHFLPIMADCERGLNRPEKAIALSKHRNVSDLDAAGKIEMRIVVSGARRDLRQFDAALAILEIPELRSGRRSDEIARLRYAYAEALLAMGRKTEARDWFVKASLADVDEVTDASERALKLGEV